MQFAERFIRRPVLASMISLGLVLVGVIAYTRLPVREFPDADPPIVSVTVILPGANPQVVESAVTDVLEEELSSVEGLRTMTSASQEQVSTITLEFTLDREIEAAAQDVRDKVSRVRGLLPEDVEEPVVAKQEADAFPIMFLALTSKTYDGWSFPTSRTARSSRGCRRFPACPVRRSTANGGSRCVCGFRRASWPRVV